MRGNINLRMKLSSLISILFLSGIEDNVQRGIWRLTFRNEAELEDKISKIHQSFCSSDEALSDPESICYQILNHIPHQVYQPNLELIEKDNAIVLIEKKRGIDLRETDPELYGKLYRELVEARERELDKAGTIYIDFTKDEFYNLFSQAVSREQKLKSICE
jgi:hypothetical protein